MLDILLLKVISISSFLSSIDFISREFLKVSDSSFFFAFSEKE
jgi:hypothetical protein